MYQPMVIKCYRSIMVCWYRQRHVFQSYFEELERSPKLQLLNDYACQLKTCQPVLTEEVDVFLKEVNTQWSTILTAVQPRNPHQDPLTMVKGETLTLSLNSPHHCQGWDAEFNLDFCIWPKTHSTRHIIVYVETSVSTVDLDFTVVDLELFSPWPINLSCDSNWWGQSQTHFHGMLSFWLTHCSKSWTRHCTPPQTTLALRFDPFHRQAAIIWIILSHLQVTNNKMKAM